MKLLIWGIVVLVIIGGLAWFMSGDSEDSSTEGGSSVAPSSEITESSSIESDDEVFAEIDNALEDLE
ncbi:hypothetical protein FJZ21_03775 [Candidatus Pacearchaeota archaeon]|nr:hypothetical protein [Candidatus Pacearchaeota archaeon]